MEGRESLDESILLANTSIQRLDHKLKFGKVHIIQTFEGF